MRTTITLDPDTHALVRRAMRDRKVSFKQAVNEAIRAGIAAPSRGPATYTFPKAMGQPRIDVTKALQVAAQLEDEEIIRKLELRK